MIESNKAVSWKHLEWSPVRPGVATGVLGHGLVPKGAATQSVSITKVPPGCEFSTHTDQYHHVFCFLGGSGEGWIGQEKYDISPQMVVRVSAGTAHGYRNTGNEELFLITINYF